MANLIVALDNCTSENEAFDIARELGDAGIKWFKVGLEMYTIAGASLVRDLKAQGFNVFLDLKLHDIPNTVAKATAVAVQTGADLLTVHCSGGPRMLEAAAKACEGSKLKPIGVTVLTSLTDREIEEIGSAWSARTAEATDRAQVAERLAAMACDAGLAGIVCSAPDLNNKNLSGLRWRAHPGVYVTPGIRGAGDARGDQTSVATVSEAVRAGATHLVVGRPIMAPSHGTRTEAAKSFLEQLRSAH